MAVSKGLDFLLKIGAVSGSPATVAGLQATSFAINNEAVEITNKDSARMRTLLEGAGTKSLTISASGVFDDGAAHDSLRANALAGELDTYSLFFDNNDTLEGAFLVTSYERSGDHNTAENFSITLESSGAYVYTAS